MAKREAIWGYRKRKSICEQFDAIQAEWRDEMSSFFNSRSKEDRKFSLQQQSRIRVKLMLPVLTFMAERPVSEDQMNNEDEGPHYRIKTSLIQISTTSRISTAELPTPEPSRESGGAVGRVLATPAPTPTAIPRFAWRLEYRRRKTN